MATIDATNISMDPNGLYREEMFTDQKLGTIRQLSPVTSAGAADAARPVLFIGQAHIVTPGGALPISFQIDATTFGEAIEKFGPAAKVAIDETVQELQEMRRQAASQIVVPEPGAASQIIGPGGVPPGGPKIR